MDRNLIADSERYIRLMQLAHRASCSAPNFKRALAFFGQLLESNGYKEIDFFVPETGKHCHSIVYSLQPQVLYNFVPEVLKFTDKGIVTVGYELTEDGHIRFWASDTGCGIPAEKQEEVFGRFVKLNNLVQGIGLGLPICKSIGERMGGKIEVESPESEGACFWFVLPYAERTDSVEDGDGPMSLQPLRENNKHPTILVAEDTDSNYLLLSTMLKKDYDLVRAYNGEEAVRIHACGGIDLILMDMKMPVMDGLEATVEIRRNDPYVPIIAVTAFAYDRDRQQALDAGCNDYMAKPIQPALLREKIRLYLAR